jgi:hypothetical protein
MQFLASIPIIGQLVSIVVELPLKLIATFSSRFRETELGAYYSQLDLKALGVSVFVPVIGSVVSRIAFREFDKDRFDRLDKMLKEEDLDSFQDVLRVSQFNDNNVRAVWNALKNKSFENKEIQSKMFCLVYKLSSAELRKELLASLTEWVDSFERQEHSFSEIADRHKPKEGTPTFQQSRQLKERYTQLAQDAKLNKMLASRISLAVAEVEAELGMH